MRVHGFRSLVECIDKIFHYNQYTDDTSCNERSRLLSGFTKESPCFYIQFYLFARSTYSITSLPPNFQNPYAACYDSIVLKCPEVKLKKKKKSPPNHFTSAVSVFNFYRFLVWLKKKSDFFLKFYCLQKWYRCWLCTTVVNSSLSTAERFTSGDFVANE